MNVAPALLRLALRSYPRSWREVHGPEVLGVFADAEDAGAQGPQLRDAIDLAVHGLRVRAGPWLLVPVNVRTSVLALIANAVMAAALVWTAEIPPATGSFLGAASDLIIMAIPVAWVAIGPRSARSLALTAVVALAFGAAFAEAGFSSRPPLILLAVQAMLAALSALSRLPDSRRYAATVLSGVVLSAVTLVGFAELGLGVKGYRGSHGVISLLASIAVPSVLLAVIATVIARIFGHRWLAAVAVVAVPVLAISAYDNWLVAPAETQARLVFLAEVTGGALLAFVVARRALLAARWSNLGRSQRDPNP